MNYFTRSNAALTVQLLREALRLRLRATPDSQQLVCLSDFSAVAVLQQFPADRVNRGLQLLRREDGAPCSCQPAHQPAHNHQQLGSRRSSLRP